MQRFLVRGLVAAALAIVTLAAPVVTVHACSCMQMDAAAAVDVADLAFVGTVVDAAPGGQDAALGISLVRYAFEVDRASRASGPIVEVAAHDDGGGASCGFTFGVGERWFVAATTEEGSLRSTLCSGNLQVEGLGDAEQAELANLLPFEPASDAPTAAAVPEATPTVAGMHIPIAAALLIGTAAAAVLALVMLLAFRRRRSS